MNYYHKLAIDRLNQSYISGWCYQRFNKNKTVNLCLRFKGTVIGRASANLFREDLLELGLHPTGKCGFELIIDPPAGSFEKGEYTLTPELSTRPLLVLRSDLPGSGIKEQALTGLRSLLPSFKRQQPLLLFMHIPKTAGTSFNTEVFTLLPKNKIATHIELDDRERYGLLARKKRFLSGHLRFGIFKEFFCHGDFQLYTIVREPYAHLHSHLKWMIKTAEENSDNYFKYSNRVIYELGIKLAQIDFGAPEQMSQFVENLSEVEAHFFDNMQTRYFCSQEIDRVSDIDFEQALNNIKSFNLIGTTEKYELFLNQFVKLHKLKKTETSRQLNRSKSEPLYDTAAPDVREILQPLVGYDLRLYNHINKTIPDQLVS